MARPGRRHGRRKRGAGHRGGRHGAEIITGAEVYAVDPNGEVRYRHHDDEHVARGRFVLAGVTPAVLAGLLGEPAPAPAPGAQVKVNMVLRRLPRLRDDSVTPEQAFGGTLHVNETWTQLDAAYSRAAGRRYRIHFRARSTAIR